jgi:hypothetical protein
MVIPLLRAAPEDFEVAAADVTTIIAELNTRRPYIVRRLRAEVSLSDPSAK